MALTAFFSQGAIQGPEEFVEGMAIGVKALVGGAVGKLRASPQLTVFIYSMFKGPKND